ncbi:MULTISPECIES: TOBE domain-containing protein [unclassified Parafrankia]|uniref:TOBE domain-containing protein n=1 Tax=unclassified Parafrankia TaxID=2994368 RepID=UPI000DA4CDD8|nr:MULTISPECIES: TOBE domain-containing protein [unclassified Parafrankia]TCJ31335.1 TOBE domain-containing protein [Parafrankia sp. BMG5.11]SQD96733.1 Molybdenum-pterin-binding protein MopA [Parafrankia sp. Ea1.12]
MSLSIRNQLTGTVSEITRGAVMSTVLITLPGGQSLTAAVTLDAVDDLGLKEGSGVDVLIKSTEISLATGNVDGLSIRNQLRGTVSSIETGGAMAVAHVTLEQGGELTAAITLAAAAELGLAAGTAVTALVKSTEVAVAAA